MLLCYNVGLSLPVFLVRFLRRHVKVCRLSTRHSCQLFSGGQPRIVGLHDKTHAQEQVKRLAMKLMYSAFIVKAFESCIDCVVHLRARTQ